jgi:hypothetical protein
MMQIISVDPHRIEAQLDVIVDLPAVAYVGIDDGKFIGSCGLAWGDSRCWLWFQTSEARPRHALQILRHTDILIRKAKQFGEKMVYAVQDTRFETSARLLELARFMFFGVENEQRIYVREVL